MASAWDQTVIVPGQVAAAGSAWDQTPSVAPAAIPVEDPGFFGSMLIGGGRTMDRMGKGLQQVYYGATGNEQEQRKLAERAAEDDKIYGRLQDKRPFATGLGESILPMALPGGGGATLGTNIARMAAAGALPSALSYGSLGERAQGAGWNALAGAAAPLIGAAGKTAWAAAEPFRQAGQDAIIGRTLNRVAGDDASKVAARLLNASPLVPGSMPTAAQVAENGGIAALERSAAAVNPEAYTARRLAQALARKTAIEEIAGTQTALDAAKAMRKEVADSTYGYARQVGPDARVFTPEAQANIAAMQARVPDSAMETARTIARVNGIPMDNTNVINGLHWTREAVSGMGHAEQNPALSSAYKGLAQDLDTGLRQISPLYGGAQDIYASMSRPINQMQVGQELRAKVLPALVDHGMLGKERANSFAQALADEGLPKRATGFPGATWENTMEPAQMSKLNAVAQDLARLKNAEDLGRGGGSDTVQKLAMQNIAAQSGMPSAMGLVTKVGGAPLDWLYRDANADMSRKLADALLNPGQAAALMNDATPTFMANSPVKKKLLEQTLLRSGFAAGPAGATVQQWLQPTP